MSCRGAYNVVTLQESGLCVAAFVRTVVPLSHGLRALQWGNIVSSPSRCRSPYQGLGKDV